MAEAHLSPEVTRSTLHSESSWETSDGSWKAWQPTGVCCDDDLATVHYEATVSFEGTLHWCKNCVVNDYRKFLVLYEQEELPHCRTASLWPILCYLEVCGWHVVGSRIVDLRNLWKVVKADDSSVHLIQAMALGDSDLHESLSLCFTDLRQWSIQEVLLYLPLDWCVPPREVFPLELAHYLQAHIPRHADVLGGCEYSTTTTRRGHPVKRGGSKIAGGADPSGTLWPPPWPHHLATLGGDCVEVCLWDGTLRRTFVASVRAGVCLQVRTIGPVTHRCAVSQLLGLRGGQPPQQAAAWSGGDTGHSLQLEAYRDNGTPHSATVSVFFRSHQQECPPSELHLNLSVIPVRSDSAVLIFAPAYTRIQHEDKLRTVAYFDSQMIASVFYHDLGIGHLQTLSDTEATGVAMTRALWRARRWAVRRRGRSLTVYFSGLVRILEGELHLLGADSMAEPGVPMGLLSETAEALHESGSRLDLISDVTLAAELPHQRLSVSGPHLSERTPCAFKEAFASHPAASCELPFGTHITAERSLAVFEHPHNQSRVGSAFTVALHDAIVMATMQRPGIARYLSWAVVFTAMVELMERSCAGLPTPVLLSRCGTEHAVASALEIREHAIENIDVDLFFPSL